MTLTMQPGDLLIYTDRIVNLSSAVPVVTTSNLFVYPTETTDMVYVTSPTLVKSISVYNLQGKLIKAEYNNSQISLGVLSKGIYLLEVISQDGRSINKIIKE